MTWTLNAIVDIDLAIFVMVGADGTRNLVSGSHFAIMAYNEKSIICIVP